MEKDNKSNSGLIIAFVIVFLVAIAGIMGTIYFYNKSLDNNIEDKPNVENNNINESLEFTSFQEFNLAANEEKEVTINNKTLKFKTVDGQLYFNNKKIEKETSYTKIYVTNLVVLLVRSYAQFGAVYSAYDLDGNKVNYSIDENYQFNNLRFEDNKLIVDVFDTKVAMMESYHVGNLWLEPAIEPCTKKLKDYPDFIEEHKDDILEADYYFVYANNELSLKVSKVKLTVGDLDLNYCISER